MNFNDLHHNWQGVSARQACRSNDRVGHFHSSNLKSDLAQMRGESETLRPKAAVEYRVTLKITPL